MKDNKFNWDIPITYAPNTMQIPKGDTVVIRNVDGSGADWYVHSVDKSTQELIVHEKMLAILN